MKTVQYLFPGGKRKVLTFSYDDGNHSDVKLAEIFTKYGMKCTFNINAGLAQRSDRKIPLSELKSIFIDNGHEIACHSFLHPLYDIVSPNSVLEDIRADRMALEEVLNFPVNGFAYPFGTYNDKVIDILKAAGIVYGRTTKANNSLHYFPDNWLEWHPTAHHKHNIMDLGKNFVERPWGINMLYIWGHAYEFDNDKNWNLIEEFCAEMSDNEKIWYATNIEIYEYVNACRSLISSAACSCVKNPTATNVWLNVDGKVVEIPAGSTVSF